LSQDKSWTPTKIYRISINGFISHSAAWAARKTHQHELTQYLRDLFVRDIQRFERFEEIITTRFVLSMDKKKAG
jgi:hypothetical protein